MDQPRTQRAVGAGAAQHHRDELFPERADGAAEQAMDRRFGARCPGWRVTA